MSDKELLTNPTDEENILQNPLEHEAEPIKEDEKYKEPLQNINDISQNVSNEIKEAAKEEQKQREADQVPFEEFGSFAPDSCRNPVGSFRGFDCQSFGSFEVWRYLFSNGSS